MTQQPSLDDHLARVRSAHIATDIGCSCGHPEHTEHWALLEAVITNNLTIAAAGWQPGPID